MCPVPPIWCPILVYPFHNIDTKFWCLLICFATCNLVLRLYMEMKAHWNNIGVSLMKLTLGHVKTQHCICLHQLLSFEIVHGDELPLE